MGQFFSQPMIQNLPSASFLDVTAPTWPTTTGIQSLTANSDGSLTPAWAAASDPTAPIEYQVYIASGSVSAAVLFQASNLAQQVTSLSTRLYALQGNVALVAGQVYTVGVRAEDGVGNVETNTVILTQTVLYNLYALVQNIQTTIGTPANGTIAADLAEIEGETDGIASIPTAPQLASVAVTQYNSVIAAIGSIQNNTNFSGIVPATMDQQFGIDTESYRFYANTFDSIGNPVDPDSNTLNVSVLLDLVSIITSTPMIRDGIGSYHYDFTVDASMLTSDVTVIFDYLKSSIAYEQIRLSKIQSMSTDSANILAIKAKTDNLPSDPASNTQVNTRLPTSSYVAPDNADIAAIKAKTDNLPSDPASESTLEGKINEVKNLTIIGL